MSRVVAVFGPTASGKSELALALAERIGGEIVSCDAMQLYAGLPILTNQPSAAQLARVPHHLVGVWPLDHEGSVGEYATLAHAAVDAALAHGSVPIVCGGSGLYLRAALGPLDLPPQPAPDARARWECMYDRAGPATAHERLAQWDPRAAAAVHPNDRRRVVRALELAEAGSSLAPPVPELWEHDTLHPTTLLCMDRSVPEVRERIAERTREMFERGVEEEVAAALRGPVSRTASSIHGLADVSAVLRGEISREEGIRRLTVRTRRYAKRQRVWMQRLPGRRDVASLDDALRAL
jgi:tRNA dimethylallyltransferase